MPSAAAGSQGIEPAGRRTGLLRTARQDPPAPCPRRGHAPSITSSMPKPAPDWGHARLPASPHPPRVQQLRIQGASKGPRRAKSPGMACWMSRAMGPSMPSPGCSESCSAPPRHGRRTNAVRWGNLPPQHVASRAFRRPLPYGSTFLPGMEEVSGDPSSPQRINSSAVKGDFKRGPKRKKTVQEMNQQQIPTLKGMENIYMIFFFFNRLFQAFFYVFKRT